MSINNGAFSIERLYLASKDETGDVESVLEGELDDFIYTALKKSNIKGTKDRERMGEEKLGIISNHLALSFVGDSHNSSLHLHLPQSPTQKSQEAESKKRNCNCDGN